VALTLLPGAALAAAVVETGNCGAEGGNVTYSLDDAGVLTLSGTGATATGSVWGSAQDAIETVVIESGVTDIGDGLFNGCGNLTGVTIADSVTSIGADAFYNCGQLTGVTIPGNVTSIGEMAFGNCSSLTEITIPDGVTSIGAAAFYGCNRLTSVTIADSVTSIGEGAFNSCSELANVNIPSGLTIIPASMFLSCGKLTGVTLPDGVTSIGDKAFSGTGLTSITIPESVTSIDSYAFSHSDLTDVTIPTGVTKMGSYVFSGCAGLTNVTIPSDTSVVGVGMFEDCTSLTSVTLPAGVTNIAMGAFSGCAGLTDVDYSGTKAQWGAVTIGDSNEPLASAAIHCSDGDILPGSGGAGDTDLPASGACGAGLTWTLDADGTLTISGTGAMEDYNNSNNLPPWFGYRDLIETVVIETGVTSIGNHAFDGCSGMTEVSIPGSVTRIGDYALRGCSALTSLTLPDGVTSTGDMAFTGCDGLTSVTIPGSLTNVGRRSFYGCDGLTSVTLLPGVAGIGEHAFASCGSLTSVTIPGSVTSIGDSAFNQCTALTSVALPDGVISIGEYAFGECYGLTSVTIPDSVTSIGKGAFLGCSGLTGVTLSNGLTSLASNLFNGCYNLTSVTVPASVTSIGAEAFSECDQLTGVTIPVSVTSIGAAAFHNCTSLTDVYYSGTKAQWGAVTVVADNEPLASATIHCSDGDILPEAISGECGKGLTWTLDAAGKLTIRGTGPMWDYTDRRNARAAGPWAGHEAEIRSLVVEDGVTSIGAYAFQSCGNLKTAEIADSVETIGQGAFEFCYGLESIRLPAALTAIAPHTLCFCSSLTDVDIPSGVTGIGEWAFYECESLTHIAVPDTVRRVDEMAFYGCEKLENVSYEGTVEQWLDIEIAENNAPLLSAEVFCSDGTLLPSGVKYVPYSFELGGGAELVQGTLPSGLSLSGGVLSGVPMADGAWTFTIELDGERKLLALRILDNTDAAVQRPNDYMIEEYVGEMDPERPGYFLKDSYKEETLVIDGPYDQFFRLLIDGRPQERGEDYAAEEGSTVITIRAQTFARIGEGTHTIAAEFRPEGAGAKGVKKAAQNYTLRLPGSSGGKTPSYDGGGGSKKKPDKQQSQQTVLPFTDVSPSDWFYQDVVWAYENKVMLGVTETAFKPQDKVSQAAVVTVLARLAQVDLSQFQGAEEEGIVSGRSFTAAAVWARRAGLLPEESAFTGGETTNRNEMAVMLVKYLRSMGKDTTPPAEAASFADAAEMTAEGNAAFQTLYRLGIFKGVGGMRMNPSGSTTRAHFVALIHRIYTEAMS